MRVKINEQIEVGKKYTAPISIIDRKYPGRPTVTRELVEDYISKDVDKDLHLMSLNRIVQQSFHSVHGIKATPNTTSFGEPFANIVDLKIEDDEVIASFFVKSSHYNTHLCDLINKLGGMIFDAVMIVDEYGQNSDGVKGREIIGFVVNDELISADLNNQDPIGVPFYVIHVAQNFIVNRHMSPERLDKEALKHAPGAKDNLVLTARALNKHVVDSVKDIFAILDYDYIKRNEEKFEEALKGHLSVNEDSLVDFNVYLQQYTLSADVALIEIKFKSGLCINYNFEIYNHYDDKNNLSSKARVALLNHSIKVEGE